jgi:hypothetical protein
MNTGVISPGVKRQGCEADHSFPPRERLRILLYLRLKKIQEDGADYITKSCINLHPHKILLG